LSAVLGFLAFGVVFVGLGIFAFVAVGAGVLIVIVEGLRESGDVVVIPPRRQAGGHRQLPKICYKYIEIC
jgi:hypothetical protein